eukprot:SAG31_NODE_3658_length_4017_cov_1.748596_1_plen_338_part_10
MLCARAIDNFEMAFQGLYSSNHVEITAPFYEAILAYAKSRGGSDAAMFRCSSANSSGTGIGGVPTVVHLPVQIGPRGLKNGGSDGIHFNAAFAALNFISAYEFSQNRSFLQVSYPYLRAVAAWYVCWLRKDPLPSGGYRWNDRNACTYEGCSGGGGPAGAKLNPAVSIAFIRRIFRHLIGLAVADPKPLISPPEVELAAWRDVVDHLAPLPVGTCCGGKPVLLPQEFPLNTFPNETGQNPLEFYSVWPGEQIGLSSEKALLVAATNTLQLANVTDPLQNNGFQLIYPAFVRAGLNATTTLTSMERNIAERMPENGFLAQAGGGIETAGAVVAVNDMLL